MFLNAFRRTACDPLSAGQPGHRAPEGVERQGTQILLELLRQALGCAMDAEDLVAVHSVMGFWRDADIHRGALVEPPAELGTLKVWLLPPQRGVDRLRL